MTHEEYIRSLEKSFRQDLKEIVAIQKESEEQRKKWQAEERKKAEEDLKRIIAFASGALRNVSGTITKHSHQIYCLFIESGNIWNGRWSYRCYFV